MFVSDKDQEVDLEPQNAEQDEHDEGGGVGVGGGKVMSTIKGVGNKSLTHTNSLNTITSKVIYDQNICDTMYHYIAIET